MTYTTPDLLPLGTAQNLVLVNGPASNDFPCVKDNIQEAWSDAPELW